MTLPSEVKFKIRAIALDLETFTVAEMARVTSLNPASIRTELQRMKRRGYLTSEPIREDRSGPGAPAHRYRLTDDPEKRLALARSIEPFYAPIPTARPLSLHYQAAMTLAERLESGELSAAERKDVLRDAQHHLVLAVEEEGIDIRPEAETAVASAYLDLLRARLAIAAGQLEGVEPLLATARQAFACRGLDEMVAQADSLQTALVVERTLTRVPADSSLSDRLLADLAEASGALPLPTVRRMLNAMRTATSSGWQASAIQSLSRTLEMVIANDLAGVSSRVVQTELRQEADEMARSESVRALSSQSALGGGAPIPAPDLFRPPASRRSSG